MAITQYYCNPAINANSGTGTIGDPFGDVQFALNSITRNVTDGDQVNVKAGTAEVLAATLTLATYGTPTEAAPLILRGYTAVANDGGRAQITPGGAFAIVGSVKFTFYIDIQLTSVASQWATALNSENVFINCLIDGAGKGLSGGQQNFAFRCTFQHSGSAAGEGCVSFQNGAVINCLFVEPSLNAWNTQKSAARFAYAATGGSISQGNIIILNDTGAIHGISVEGGYHGLTTHNVVYNRAAGIGAGVYMDENNSLMSCNCYNNLLCGFSGVGGRGISTGDANFILGMLGSNAFYNCTTNENLTEAEIYRVAGDLTLLADPLVNVAGGDYILTDAAKLLLRSAGWPSSYLGAAADPHITIGAVQYGAAEAGGGAVSISPFRGNIG